MGDLDDDDEGEHHDVHEFTLDDVHDLRTASNLLLPLRDTTGSAAGGAPLSRLLPPVRFVIPAVADEEAKPLLQSPLAVT